MPMPRVLHFSLSLMPDTAVIVQTFAVYAIPVLLAITLHEASHAYASWYLGDDTARSLGRVTLNPFRHIDLLGTVVMPLLLYFGTGGRFVFGYAKPVPVQAHLLRNPRRDMALVALAGPGSNALQAIVWMAVGYVLPVLDMQPHEFLPRVCQAGVLSNLVMFAFNLFPMLPLDGGRILAGLLPPQWAARFSRIEPFGFYIVMALVMMRVITTWWMLPVITITLYAIETLLSPLRFLLS